MSTTENKMKIFSNRNIHIALGIIIFGMGIASAQFYDNSKNESAKTRAEFSRLLGYLIGGGIIMVYLGEVLMGQLQKNDNKMHKVVYYLNIAMSLIFLGFLSMVANDASSEGEDSLATTCYVLIALNVLFLVYCIMMVFVNKTEIEYDDMYNFPTNMKQLDFSDIKSKFSRGSNSVVSNTTTTSSGPIVGNQFGSDSYNLLGFGKRKNTGGRRKRY